MKLFKGTLSIGVQLGLFDQGFKGSEVYIPDGDDYHEKNDNAIPTNDLHGTAFDLNFGVWYTHKILWAGLSMTHITQPTVKLNTQEAATIQAMSRRREECFISWLAAIFR